MLWRPSSSGTGNEPAVATEAAWTCTRQCPSFPSFIRSRLGGVPEVRSAAPHSAFSFSHGELVIRPVPSFSRSLVLSSSHASALPSVTQCFSPTSPSSCSKQPYTRCQRHARDLISHDPSPRHHLIAHLSQPSKYASFITHRVLHAK